LESAAEMAQGKQQKGEREKKRHGLPGSVHGRKSRLHVRRIGIENVFFAFTVYSWREKGNANTISILICD
jgi:hypothetical protein